MTHQYLNTTRRPLPEAVIAQQKITETTQTFLRFGAGIGLLGGTSLLFGAIFLTVFEYFYSEHLHGNWVFLTVLPLWVLGAICLDKLEIAEKARRIEYCKSTGMKEKDCADNHKN